MVYLLRKQPSQCHYYIWVLWWVRCISLFQPSLCGFACGLAQTNCFSAQRCHVSSFRWAKHKERFVCLSKGLEVSLPFTHLPLSGARSCSLTRATPLARLSPSQTRRKLRLKPQLNLLSCPEPEVSCPQGCHRIAHLMEHTWVSTNQPAAQALLPLSFWDIMVIAVSFGVKSAPDQRGLWWPHAFQLS